GDDGAPRRHRGDDGAVVVLGADGDADLVCIPDFGRARWRPAGLTARRPDGGQEARRPGIVMPAQREHSPARSASKGERPCSRFGLGRRTSLPGCYFPAPILSMASLASLASAASRSSPPVRPTLAEASGPPGFRLAPALRSPTRRGGCL